MKEIISIHLGSSGINPGKAFWKLKSYENGIGEDGVLTNKKDMSEVNSFFFETIKGEYKARALFVDTDSNTTEDLKKFEMQNIIDEGMIFNSLSVPCSTWASSHYLLEKDLTEKFIDKLTCLAEICDSLEGVQTFYSLHGAFSSGFGSLLSSNLSDQFGDKFKFNIQYNSFLSSNSNTFENYNTLLSIANKCDISVLYDYDSLNKYCTNILGMEDIVDYDMDSIIGRIPQYDYLSNKNLPPLIEQLKFPYVDKNFAFATVEFDEKSNLNKIIENSMSSDYNLLSITPNQIMRKHFSFKGKVTQKEVAKPLDKCKSLGKFTEEELKFENFTTSFSTKPIFIDDKLEEKHVNLTTLTINNGIAQLLDNFEKNVSKSYEKRAYVHYYVGEGMEEGEFSENFSKLGVLIRNYKDIC